MKIDWKKISIKDLAALICRKLNDNGIDAILVGGAYVTPKNCWRPQGDMKHVFSVTIPRH